MSGYHLRAIEIAVCLLCGKRATKEVFNAYNASLGKYCSRHAKQRLRELQQDAQRLKELENAKNPER